MTKNRRLMKYRVITKEITRFLLLLWSLTIYVGPIKTIIQTYFFFKFIQTEFIQKKKERWMIKLISITKLKVSMRRPWYALQKFTNIIFLPERLPTIYNSLIFFYLLSLRYQGKETFYKLWSISNRIHLLTGF